MDPISLWITIGLVGFLLIILLKIAVGSPVEIPTQVLHNEEIRADHNLQKAEDLARENAELKAELWWKSVQPSNRKLDGRQ
jgi:hypothetical protein